MDVTRDRENTGNTDQERPEAQHDGQEMTPAGNRQEEENTALVAEGSVTPVSDDEVSGAEEPTPAKEERSESIPEAKEQENEQAAIDGGSSPPKSRNTYDGRRRSTVASRSPYGVSLYFTGRMGVRGIIARSY